MLAIYDLLGMYILESMGKKGEKILTTGK